MLDQKSVPSTRREGHPVTRRLIDFDSPPVVETTLGVSFAPIQEWTLLHHGMLWVESLRGRYASAGITAPAGPIEPREFLVDTKGDFIAGLPVQSRYVNEDNTQLLHVQRNSFVRHWRATADCHEYQHYDKFLPLFESDWKEFLNFLDRNRLSPPAVWQWQVTYINHLLRGREWQSLDDIPELFPALGGVEFGSGRWKSMKLGPFALQFAAADDVCLQIVCSPGIRASDQQEILELSLTATGKPSSSDLQDVTHGFDAGHAAIVDNFAAFTSGRLHELWRRR